MIHNFKYMFGAFMLQSVIEQGGQIKQNEAGAVNAETDDTEDIPMKARQNDENHQTRDTYAKTNAACNAIGNLFE